jgi:hypothetical protein
MIRRDLEEFNDSAPLTRSEKLSRWLQPSYRSRDADLSSRLLAGERTMETSSKTQMLDNLRSMLRDVFRLRSEGASFGRLARAHGYVDGYMRVLLESGLAGKAELLALVARERSEAEGPATAVIEAEVAA